MPLATVCSGLLRSLASWMYAACVVGGSKYASRATRTICSCRLLGITLNHIARATALSVIVFSYFKFVSNLGKKSLK